MAELLYRPKKIEIDRPDLYQVGDVLSSMLTEAEFQAKHGTNWVLMDGRDVTGSRYGIIKTGSKLIPANIPDARGRFLRGRDYGFGANPDGDQLEGVFNDFKTSASGLSVSTQVVGNHTHTLIDVSLQATGSSGTSNRWVGGGTKNLTSAGGHSHTISFNGANETAPVNLIVNMFIKIN